MKNKNIIKKLNEEDILEIIIEHFQNEEFVSYGKGLMLGKPGEDLRFIGFFSNDIKEIRNQNLEKLDKITEYNGDHSLLEKHPEFVIKP